jgi:hypothetical protein
MLDDLKIKVADVINSLTVALSEVEQIEDKRKALEASQIVNTQREERLNGIAKTQVKEKEDIEAQKKYIDEQNKNTQTVLNKILLEKEELKVLLAKKSDFDKEKLQFEADKKSFDTLKEEREKFIIERQTFEEERKLFSREKLANIEAQKLLVTREENIKAKEERLDKIDRMTSL